MGFYVSGPEITYNLWRPMNSILSVASGSLVVAAGASVRAIMPGRCLSTASVRHQGVWHMKSCN